MINPGPEAFDATPVNGPSSAREPTSFPAATPWHEKRIIHPDLRPHFATLNISTSSSDEAIRSHYKRLARLWHPDKNPENVEEAKAKFQAISTAYSAIKTKLRL